MQVATVSASTILRNTSSQSDASATGAAPNAGVLKLQQASLTLDRIRQSMSSDADDAKSRAQRKLEEAKQELQALRTAGFPPEVIARMAAELARKVGAAASEFAAAVATGGSAGTAAPAANAASAVTADVASAATVDTAAAATDTTDTDSQTTGTATSDAKKADSDTKADDKTADTDAAAQARKAYQSVVEDGPKSSGISAEDRQTMEEFKSVINELKQILEKAMRELRQKNRQGDNDDQATTGSAGHAAEATAATIPSSIVI